RRLPPAEPRCRDLRPALRGLRLCRPELGGRAPGPPDDPRGCAAGHGHRLGIGGGARGQLRHRDRFHDGVQLEVGGGHRLPRALNLRATSDTSRLVVAALTPAVQQDGSGNISVAGLQPAMTQFSIDGISTERTRGGGGPGAQPRDLFPSVESMEEFKVNTAGNNAEYLQATDITTTSKSGTNALHGTLYGFLQDSALGATDPFAASKPSVKGKTFGATLGGPVVSNRTFFFVSYEGVRRPQDIPISQVVPPDAYRSGDLSSVGTPIVDPATGQPFPG